MSSNITSDDFCRACRGRKVTPYEDERNGRRVTVYEPCWHCEGTGKQTVLVGQR